MRSFSRIFRFYVRLQIPAVLAVLAVLFAHTNARLLPGPECAPLVVLMCVFYWACYWPRLLHPGLIFALGMLEDILSGGIIGVRAFLYLVIYALILSQRRLILKEPFPVVWALFSFSALLYTLMMLVVFRLDSGIMLIGWVPCMQWLVTVACYPFVHQCCLWIQLYLVKARPTRGRWL